MNLFLDTNAVLYFLKGDPRAVKIVRGAESFGISFITVAELLSFDCDPAERNSIEQLIRLLKVYYPDSETTPIIIDLRKTTKIKLPDCIIAAQAKQNNLTLVTFDKEMIEKFSKKLPIYPTD